LFVSSALFGAVADSPRAAETRPRFPASPGPDPVLLDFILGHYDFVGRDPDSVSAYTGTAVIARHAGKVTLTRTIGSKVTTATVSLEVPAPPGEGTVLRVRWHDGEPRLMTCLISGDLDNYARLSCVWIIEGRDHRSPGLESYFSTDARRAGARSG
jgi:hypothetical protein